jgi:hypothetical protein
MPEQNELEWFGEMLLRLLAAIFAEESGMTLADARARVSEVITADEAVAEVALHVAKGFAPLVAVAAQMAQARGEEPEIRGSVESLLERRGVSVLREPLKHLAVRVLERTGYSRPGGGFHS